MKITFQEFRRSPYFFFKYFLFSMLTVAVPFFVLLNTSTLNFIPELTWGHLWLLPFAFVFGIQVPVILHNAVHFNISPRWLNELIGELCGFFVLFGMAPFRISHVMHHAHADTELDTHPPMGKSFAHFLATTQLNTIRVIAGQYFERHGHSRKTHTIMAGQMVFYYLGLVMRLGTWFILLGPTYFVAFYLPAYITNLVVFAHINFATHQTLPSGEVIIVNLNHNLYYRVVNALSAGAYFHKNHHLRPKLYNPSKLTP
jgi:fatty acid desaturase